MIRRRVEYIIICDCERLFGKPWCDGSANAYNSDSAEDCAVMAKSEGWQQISPRLWLSKKCAEKYEAKRASESQR